MRVFITHFTPSTTITMKNKEVENSMNNMEDITKTGDGWSIEESKSIAILRCITIFLKLMFDFDNCVGQVTYIFRCLLHYNWNDYELFEAIVCCMKNGNVQSLDVGGELYLMISEDECFWMINHDSGKMFYGRWKSKNQLPKKEGQYLCDKHGLFGTYYYTDSYFYEDGYRQTTDIIRWCALDDLKQFSPIEDIL